MRIPSGSQNIVIMTFWDDFVTLKFYGVEEEGLFHFVRFSFAVRIEVRNRSWVTIQAMNPSGSAHMRVNISAEVIFRFLFCLGVSILGTHRAVTLERLK